MTSVNGVKRVYAAHPQPTQLPIDPGRFELVAGDTEPAHRACLDPSQRLSTLRPQRLNALLVDVEKFVDPGSRRCRSPANPSSLIWSMAAGDPRSFQRQPSPSMAPGQGLSTSIEVLFAPSPTSIMVVGDKGACPSRHPSRRRVPWCVSISAARLPPGACSGKTVEVRCRSVPLRVAAVSAWSSAHTLAIAAVVIPMPFIAVPETGH